MKKEMRVRYKFWFESSHGYVFGKGAYQLLKAIDEGESISKAAESLGMSYRHAWGIIKEAERNMGENIVTSVRGGRSGGKTKLTEYGHHLLREYERYQELFEYILRHPYKKPSLTVDGILIENNAILLIKRKREPFRDMYALPGGFVEYGETVENAIVREMEEETGLLVSPQKIVGVYSDPHRDPRGHTVTVVFSLRRIGGSIKGGDDALVARFISIDKLPPLAFDHSRIVDNYLKNKEIKK